MTYSMRREDRRRYRRIHHLAKLRIRLDFVLRELKLEAFYFPDALDAEHYHLQDRYDLHYARTYRQPPGWDPYIAVPMAPAYGVAGHVALLEFEEALRTAGVPASHFFIRPYEIELTLHAASLIPIARIAHERSYAHEALVPLLTQEAWDGYRTHTAAAS